MKRLFRRFNEGIRLLLKYSVCLRVNLAFLESFIKGLEANEAGELSICDPVSFATEDFCDVILLLVLVG